MDQVSLVREKIDLVNLIATYVPLKKLGNNFKANCPFHNEKTPSFVVSPERQIWHCFGCSKGGDCFSFLMEYEHIEFPEALRILAEKAGIALEQTGYDSSISSKKEIIYKINAIAMEFYHYLLTKHAVGKRALAYVESRKIKPQTIETYMLGFAPTSGNALTQYLLQKKKYNAEDLFEAGLVTKRMGRIADFFVDRLMFPLYDHRGNVIGFSGRILHTNDQVAKYINTRETLVYHKGSVFFGLNSSKDAIKKTEQAIVMEGELDVIAAFQEGITNTVAIKGTALTEDQVNLISRFAKKITLCFDGDNAGQEAMKRSIPIIEKKGLQTTVIVIPNGKDPDESIKTDVIAFKNAVKKDLPVYDVILDRAIKKYPSQTAEGKKKIGDEVLPFLVTITNEIVKEHYLRLLAKSIDTSYDVLIKEIDKIHKKEIVKQDIVITNKEKKPREEILEEYLLALLIQFSSPALLLPQLTQFLDQYIWGTPAYGKIALKLKEAAIDNKAFTIKEFLATLPQELVGAFDTCFLLPLPEFKNDEYYAKEVQKTAEELFVVGIKRRIKDLTHKISILEKEENEEKLIALQEQLSPLLKQLSGIKQG
ncbi:MAG TPA: DNA primase [Patescibacteria group bacterium]